MAGSTSCDDMSRPRRSCSPGGVIVTATGAPRTVGAVECGRHPDMVEPAPTVRGAPVAVTITPPGEQLLLGRDMSSHDVDPAMRGADLLQPVGLRRRVAHHFQELLVGPDIGGERGHVEIAR